MTVIHILWVGILGVVFGSVVLDRTAFMVGIGRIAGLIKSNKGECSPLANCNGSVGVVSDRKSATDTRQGENAAVTALDGEAVRDVPVLPRRDSEFDS